MSGPRPATIPMRTATLRHLQQESFSYFLHQTNRRTGLVRDKTKRGWPASIAAVGMALTAYPIGVERRLITRKDAVRRVLTALRFLWNAPQGKGTAAAGYKGFYYHFLDMETGRRAHRSEVSTMDSALLFAGALTAAAYFQRGDAREREIRTLADAIYRRADWRWAQGRGASVSHGWKPECGLMRYRWEGYDEALVLYVLGLGSPTHPLPPESYAAWLSTYRWREIYGIPQVAGAGGNPLFAHQLSHLWIDFRGIRDAYMRERGIDYFENSRRATLTQQQYTIRNPRGFRDYNETCWGLTATDGPGPRTLKVDGVVRRFYDYVARGVPDGPDDGTLAPWAVVASLPFAPEIVTPTVEYYRDHLHLHLKSPYGFKATFNATYPEQPRSPYGWVSPYNYGINQGPIVIMVENYRTGLVWDLMRTCPYVVEGLRRAGFEGGWL